MKARRHRMIVSRIEYGAPMAGHCSVCHRPFEVELSASETLSEAKERLNTLFEQHVCQEDSSQVALRVMREATENK